MKRIWRGLEIAGTAALLMGLVALSPASAEEATPIGAWFGIARPCPAGPDDSAEHAAFCTDVCGLCPNSGALPLEVPMMPTLLADGTLLADDSAELSLYHTTAYGKWERSKNDGLFAIKGTKRYKATFMWLGQSGPTARLDHVVRPRFVTYFDKKDPDRMIGYIQPYFFPLADNGTVVVNPVDPEDPFAGDHIPTIDPLTSPLPPGCEPANGCLATYHFIIRRIKSQ